ncbi:MAG: SRPBCC domain-containing protein [Acidobacteriaceae bacterium]
MSTPVQAALSEMELTRIIHAPRALVWSAWTNINQLQQWWGPKHFTNPRCEADFRVGGAIHIDMRAPDGTLYPMGGEFEEIDPPKRLVFLSSALDPNGDPIFTNRNSVTFREADGNTEIAIHVRVVKTTGEAWQYLKGMREGWSLSLDKLATLVETH